MIIIKTRSRIVKMDYYKAFPSYMGYGDMPYNNTIYQGYGSQNRGAIQQQPMALPEDRILEDMEYLQQMYPTYAKRYQSVISSVVDKMDYDSSFIYDQYPDKFSIQRMVESVMIVIKSDEEKEAVGIVREEKDPEADITESENVTADTLTERAPWSEKESWIRELVTVLMYYEILARRKRRQKKYWII